MDPLAHTVPGLLGLVGLVLHHTVYRRQWLVSAKPQSSSDDDLVQWIAPNRGQAEQGFAELINWLEAGRSLAEIHLESSPGLKRVATE